MEITLTNSACILFISLNLIGGGLCLILIFNLVGEILNGRRVHVPVELTQWELHLRFTQYMLWRNWRKLLSYKVWFHLGISSVLWVLSGAVWVLGLDSKTLSPGEKMGITLFYLTIQFGLSFIMRQASRNITDNGASGVFLIASLPYMVNLSILILLALIIGSVSLFLLFSAGLSHI